MPVSLRSKSLKIQNETEKEECLQSVVKKRRARTKDSYSDNPDEEDKPMRNVEEIRRKNLEDNRAFLEGLLMTKIRDDFKSLTHTLQPTVKKRDIKYVTITENVPVRRSRRLAHMDINGNKLPSPEVSENEMETNETQQIVYKQKIRKHVEELSSEEQTALNEKLRTFFEENKNLNMKTEKNDYDASDLDILDVNVLKLTPDRLISMDIHDRSDILAILGGDRKGTIGLVVKSINELNGGWSKINYDFHSEYATCCRFNRSQSNQIHSTAYDSTFRMCDITKNISIEIFKNPEGHGLTSFDYRSPDTCLISDDKGDVFLIDLRANPVIVERFDATPKRIRTMHINPKQTDEFCISGTDQCVKIWDLRNMSSLKFSLTTDRSCYGAYYNQIGSHIIATTRDDHLISFSMDSLSKAKDPLDILPIKKIHHRNFINRFVTPFTAQPHAKFESNFLIGSDKYPREIAMIDENCQTKFSLRSENLNSLATINIAHRALPIIVGGNSSGRIHVFTGQI